MEYHEKLMDYQETYMGDFEAFMAYQMFWVCIVYFMEMLCVPCLIFWWGMFRGCVWHVLGKCYEELKCVWEQIQNMITC